MPNDNISYFERTFVAGQFLQLRDLLGELWGVQAVTIRAKGSTRKPDKQDFPLDDQQLSQVVELTDEGLTSVTLSVSLPPSKYFFTSIYASGAGDCSSRECSLPALL